MDTAHETDFDDIVELASRICDMPISLISLVDDERQWFKARVGFELEETTLDQSVCSHAILQDEFLEIENMAEDVRTTDNPLHTGPRGVSYYAGVNLVAPNGMSIGTLCVLDTKPRKLTEFQRQALKTLSRQVVIQLELRKKVILEESLRDEVDHRVKNSLQTIASIMRVAARDVDDPKALEVLKLVERRLGAVALLHTELTGRDGKGSVDTKHYVERIVKLLADVSPDNVAINANVADGTLEAQKASALGMIISEFVANSIKHAFPDGRQGLVRISLDGSTKVGWTLICSDNGVGNAHSGESDGSGLGAMLMSSAAAQLEGELDYDGTHGGARLTVKFEN